jgi:predicted nucleotide-binding protein
MDATQVATRLRSLRDRVDEALKDPRLGCFDYGMFAEFFERYARIRDQLRSQHAPVFADTPMRETPKPSGTRDFEGRGYIERRHLELLRRDLNDCLDLIPLLRSPPQREGGPETDSNSVFVVHGHDEARESVARLLERLGLKPIILHEQPNWGRTIIEKFESHAAVGFAVVLLTPDDVGSAASDPEALKPRARQNVIFELGFFVAALGRRRVFALYKGDVDLPTDYTGVVYTPLDPADGWQLKLARELKHAGLDVDLNKVV